MKITQHYTTNYKKQDLSRQLRQKSNFRNQQGLGLISIVLFTALVLASVVGITATMAITAKRTTTDQMMVLRAQYAAESGLSVAKLKLGEFEKVVNMAKYPITMTTNELMDHATDFCAARAKKPTKAPAQWTVPELNNGYELCSAKDLGTGNLDGMGRMSVLSNYITTTDMRSIDIEASQSDYWNELFGNTQDASTVLQAGSEGVVKYEIDYNLTPKSVNLLRDEASFRFVFGLGNVVAKGILEDLDGNIIATRKLQIGQSSQEMYIEISKPSFAQYGYFADTRTTPSGSPLHFTDDMFISGRVHINNGTFFHATSRTGGPRFSGKFSSADPSITWNRNATLVNDEIMFLGGSEFNAQRIALPDNNHIQLNKVLATPDADTEAKVCEALGLSTTSATCTGEATGIFYTQGDGVDQPNSTDEFFGGIYVKGDVNSITLSSPDGEDQNIKITHSNGTIAEFYNSGPSWKVKHYTDPNTTSSDPSALGTIGSILANLFAKEAELLGNFNGLIFVDGDIGCENRQNYDEPCNTNVTTGRSIDGLKGDGTDLPDLAEDFMLTITGSGNIVLKDNITYATQPFCEDDVKNIMGIFTPGGNIMFDGPYNKNLIIDGVLMASLEGKGTGSVDPTSYNRGSDPKLIFFGGVVEHTNQGIGQFNSTTGTRIYGYGRSWEFDCRLSNGFAPPFFPTQEEWDKQYKFNGVNNRAVWRLN